MLETPLVRLEGKERGFAVLEKELVHDIVYSAMWSEE